MMEFNDTFKGTVKNESSGQVPSEFTVNKTVSNLDPRNDSKGFPRSTIEGKEEQFSGEERKAQSQEKKQGTGLMEKLKNSIFGSGKKEFKKNTLEVNDLGKKKREKSPENDYKVDFDAPPPEMKKWNVNVKSQTQAQLVKELKKENNKMKRQDSLAEIKKPNDISIINLTKKKEQFFKSPSKVEKEKSKSGKNGSHKKSTGKPMNFQPWGQKSINALKKDLKK